MTVTGDRADAATEGRVGLDTARAWCKTYTKDRAKNFYFAFAILPEAKRNAIYAAYAFSGLVDDIADELDDRAEQTRQMADARVRLHACAGGEREGPLFTALGGMFDEFRVPVEFFDLLVDGVEMDFTINRYATWTDLREYCYHVASMVGLICTSVFGVRPHAQARDFAVDMGIGLQIVNIMRDVKEDAARGRVYFAAEDLERHSLTAEDILDCRYDERFASLMKDYGLRAREHFANGRKLLPLLDLRSRMCVNVLQGVYFDILQHIERRKYDVLTERVSLSTAQKLVLIGRLWVKAAMVRPA